MENKNTKPTLTVCLLTKESVCANTAFCFIQAINDKEITSYVEIHPMFATGQSDLPKARSEQVSNWYDNMKDNIERKHYFMFIDSDQTFTTTDIMRSLYFMEKYDVVCGAYARKDGSMTVQPKKVISFYSDKEGELWYGSTGFMMFSIDIVNKMISSIGPKIEISSVSSAYTLFYERIVNEPELNRTNIWLSEDYSFCWLARQHEGTVYGYISPTIGHILPNICTVQIPKSVVWPEKSIVVYCGSTSEKWSPNNLKTGIGGSELAVIKLTDQWAKQGYKVTVFCACDSPGVYNDVKYEIVDNFSPTDVFDTIIIWRSIDFLNYIDLKAKKCLLDLHDVVRPGQITKRVLDNVTKICVKSEYHKSLLGDVIDSKVSVIPNGGAVTTTSEIKKDQNLIVYSSSYDRGIAFMLKWGWPKIKQECPDARLVIAYGWNCFDSIQPKTAETQLYKQTIQDLMKQEGVSEIGRISQEELLKIKEKANIHWYTGDFQEICCISIRESATLQCIPVVSDYVEVFREKPYCVLVEGDPHTKEMQEKSAEIIIDYIKNPNKCIEYREKTNFPINETWENTAKKWLEIIN